MNRKTLVVTVLAVVSISVVLAVSAVTVFALVGGDSAPVEEVQVDQTVEVAPVQAEAPAQIQVVNPVLTGERVSSGGCPYDHAAKSQLTKAPSQKLETESLALVGQ